MRAPSYAGVVQTSRYITARDGVRLAADIYLPRDLGVGTTLPTLLEQRRHSRGANRATGEATDAAEPFVVTAVTRGYAYVIAEVRGAGASFGVRGAELSKTEVADSRGLIDWIVQQPWSNQRVGTTGEGYAGLTAYLSLETGHPALKAVAPRFAPHDLFADLAAPGGLRLQSVLDGIGRANSLADGTTPGPAARGPKAVGARPVDGDSGRALLSQAIRGHQANIDIRVALARLNYRDGDDSSGYDINALSPHSMRGPSGTAAVPVLSYGGWWDGGNAAGTIKRFRSLPLAKRFLVLGPWTRGGTGYDPTFGRYRSSFPHDQELLRFFDLTLKGIGNGAEIEPRVRYFTMGENRWKAAGSWPVPNRRETWYLADGRTLTPVLPGRRIGGKDRIEVDNSTGTGSGSRWTALLTPEAIEYPKRRDLGPGRISFASAPLPTDVEITGHPIATIYIETPADDGAIFVYVEDVEPGGPASYVTEGQLRFVHRRTSRGKPPYPTVGPYHSMLRRDARPMAKNQPTGLEVELQPTSYLFRRGHRIQVTVAGADRDHFAPVPGESDGFDLLRTARHPSHIILPIIRRK